jgi:hypothetical protein
MFQHGKANCSVFRANIIILIALLLEVRSRLQQARFAAMDAGLAALRIESVLKENFVGSGRELCQKR